MFISNFNWFCFGTGKNYYSSVFLEECKNGVWKKILKYIIDDTKISSDSDKENSDEENSDDEDNFDDEKILMKKIRFFYIYKYHKNLPDYRRNYFLAYKK